jgi:hypothetical protein
MYVENTLLKNMGINPIKVERATFTNTWHIPLPSLTQFWYQFTKAIYILPKKVQQIQQLSSFCHNNEIR